ncbi:MAG: DUF2267 domain-containing protein [Anaerolinea sp.]|nr:DUF2267 domain-containing protein [Anaerolinea sp.]
MAERGLEGIDHTVQQTYIWVDEIARLFHGNRHQAFQILRSFLHVLRDHIGLDESAQFAAQLPLLIRGLYYEGWDPSHSLVHERTADTFMARFVSEAGIRPMDGQDALAAVGGVVGRHVSDGEAAQILSSLPAAIRRLLTAA